MATKQIPNNLGQIRQYNRGELFGELSATKGIDLYSSPGKIKVSKKLRSILNTGGSVGVPTDERIEGIVQAILVHTNTDQDATNQYIWIITQDYSYRCSLDSDPTNFANWERIFATSGETDSTSDAVVFNNNIVTSYSTNIAKHNGDSTYDNDWWTAAISGTALTAQRPHTLHVTRSGTETLHVCDGNLVRYYNTAAGHSTLTLSETQIANIIMSGVSTNWVGTYSKSSQNALVYTYQIGATADATALPNNAFEIDGHAVLSGDVMDNIPYIVTDRGHIQIFNGAGFKTVASFPFAEKGLTLSGQNVGRFTYGTSASIAPKGMRRVGDRFWINIDTTSNLGAFPVDERSPAGVWEFDPETGSLHHLYSLAENATDYGAFRINESGPILQINNQYVNVLVGAGGTFDGLYMDTDETPVAYFVTPEYYGDSITQAWEKIVSVHDTLDEGQEIKIKYRNTKDPNHPTYINTVNWLNSTQFTTTNALAANIAVGNEIEILSVYRAGYIATVTAVEASAATYTITIDAPIGFAGETSNIKVENWTEHPEVITSADLEFASRGIGETNPRIQFKVILTGHVTINKLITKGNSKNEL